MRARWAAPGKTSRRPFTSNPLFTGRARFTPGCSLHLPVTEPTPSGASPHTLADDAERLQGYAEG